MHGGDEITVVCIKYMTAEEADGFVKNNDEMALAKGLQHDPDDPGTAESEIQKGHDDEKGPFVEVKFFMEVMDIENIDKWCAAEGFEVLEKTFGSHI